MLCETLRNLTKACGVNCESGLAKYPIALEDGIDPSNVVDYIVSPQFQKDQKELLVELDELLYNDREIENIVIFEKDFQKFSIKIQCLPLTLD